MYARARVGVALGDAFIACWHTKYRTHVLRQVSYIERHDLDPRWRPLLMTPPLPEYPSGHSVASAAAAEVLTELFGDVRFTDRTHEARRFRPRSFRSFHEAASEAAISRLYGGTHYPMAMSDQLRRCEASVLGTSAGLMDSTVAPLHSAASGLGAFYDVHPLSWVRRSGFSEPAATWGDGPHGTVFDTVLAADLPQRGCRRCRHDCLEDAGPCVR